MARHVSNLLVLTDNLLQIYEDPAKINTDVKKACDLVRHFVEDYKTNGFQEKKFVEFGNKFMLNGVVSTTILQFFNFSLFVYKEIINRCSEIGGFAHQMAIVVFKKACCITYGLEHFSEKKKHKKHNMKFSDLNMENIYNEYQKIFIDDLNGAKYIEEILATEGCTNSNLQSGNSTTDINNTIVIKQEAEAVDDTSTSEFNKHLEDVNLDIGPKSDDDSEMDEYFVDDNVDLEAFDNNGNLRSGFFNISQFENDFPDQDYNSSLSSENKNHTINDSKDILIHPESSGLMLDKCLDGNCKMELDNEINLEVAAKNHGPNKSILCQESQLHQNDNEDAMDKSPQYSEGSDMSLCSISPSSTKDESKNRLIDYFKGEINLNFSEGI